MSYDDGLPRWYKFRILGIFGQGFMKVEFVAPQQRVGSVTIHDVFLDEIPIELVPMSLRMPNIELWVNLGLNQIPIAVQGVKPKDVVDYS